METLIFLLWMLFVFANPVAFVVVGYCASIPGKHAFGIIGKGIVAFLVHIFLSFLTLTPIFIMVFAGAHSEPAGQALDIKGRLVLFAIAIGLGISGWLSSSFVYGKFIGIPARDFNCRERDNKSHAIHTVG